MSLAWEPLPWDSEFFGFGIGRVDLDGADPAAIAEVEADARREGVRCLYGSLDPADAALTFVVQELGYRFVEAATTFSLRRDEPPIPRPPGVEVRVGTEADLPDLEGLVSTLAEWSRYAVDPRFGLDAAARMQRAWIERAARCTDDQFSLTVAEDEAGFLAFVTRSRRPEPTADAVVTTARGSGAARYLIEYAREWAGEGPLRGGPIAGRNVAALRYVSHCGFRVAEVRYLYHRWLDEGPR